MYCTWTGSLVKWCFCLADPIHPSESQAWKELGALLHRCLLWMALSPGFAIPSSYQTKQTIPPPPPEVMYLIFSSVFCGPSHQSCLGTCVRKKGPFLGPGRNKQVLTSDTVYLKRSSQCRMHGFLSRNFCKEVPGVLSQYSFAFYNSGAQFLLYIFMFVW